MKHLRSSVSLITAAFIALAAGSACGLGFRNPDQGARATGQGEAFVAQADDASAIYYNPAGLTQVKGTHFTSGMYLDFPNITFHPVGGGELKAKDDMFMLPHAYVASDFGLPKWRFGLGFNIPYGNSMTWGGDNKLSPAVDKSSMAIYAVTPTVAYQITDQLSIGAALNIYYGDILSRFKFAPPSFPSSDFEFRGDGIAVGATVGVLWKPHWQHSFGVVYRSPFAVNFDGTAVVNNPPFPGFPANPGPSPANLTMDFPQSVTAGYAFRPTRKLKLEVDVEWTNWDTLNTVRVNSPNPAVADDPFGRSTISFNWKDSFFYEFGAQYELNEKWELRAGYIFSGNTVPSSTFSPNLPDSDRHVFSVGASYNTVRFTVNATYQYSRSTDRTVLGSPNNLCDGQWSSEGHAIMLTSTMRF